ncbi:hypothetical protein N7G274_004566 [Stereocaulon virgatum]|uniref:Uncharacterized protein n=1 Tax=Stereocaulon virgatum TaxID=373712 RepID=A0ABR4AAA4_9LECA
MIHSTGHEKCISNVANSLKAVSTLSSNLLKDLLETIPHVGLSKIVIVLFFAEPGLVRATMNTSLRVFLSSIQSITICKMIEATKLASSLTLLTSVEFAHISNKELIENILLDLRQ